MSIQIVHTKSGSKAEVYSYGATVTSFTTSTGRELLFLSKDAKLDGSKAIRGGIPLVFPQFGQPDLSMPQHGFARCNHWTVGESFDNDDCAGLVLSLNLDQVTHARGGRWVESGELDCSLTMEVKIQASSLSTTLKIENTGSTAFDFQTLFHTYYLVQERQALDAANCNVVGLDGYYCDDKISGDSYVMGIDPIVIDGNVDRIYTPPEGKDVVNVTIKTGGETSVALTAFGSIDGKAIPTSCVVWNPHKVKAEEMTDFNNDGYLDMVCCEPGLLSQVPKLEVGKECVFTQLMTL